MFITDFIRIYSMSIRVNILCILNPETPSVWVVACILRLSVLEIKWENQTQESGKHYSSLLKRLTTCL